MQKRVLLVDDESSLRRSLTLSLNQEGYDVEPCDNGICALKKMEVYKENNINLDTIVLDVRLPDIDGISLGKIIKSKYPETAIVFISGYTDTANQREIEGLNTTSFLQKPFSIQDLTYQFSELSKIKTTSTQVAVEEAVAPQQSVSSYALIKLRKDADFFETHRKLYFMDNVVYCDATKGDYDIFLLMQSASIEACKAFCNNLTNEIEAIEAVDFLEVGIPVLDSSLKNVIETVEQHNQDENIIADNPRDLSQKLCSYVLLEIEREKLDKIYPVLRLNENIVYCDYTSGKYNLVLLVSGDYFSGIDKFIENKIANIDGVLKIKEYPVINLFEM